MLGGSSITCKVQLALAVMLASFDSPAGPSVTSGGDKGTRGPHHLLVCMLGLVLSIVEGKLCWLHVSHRPLWLPYVVCDLSDVAARSTHRLTVGDAVSD